jgi:hypothetical protein
MIFKFYVSKLYLFIKKNTNNFFLLIRFFLLLKLKHRVYNYLVVAKHQKPLRERCIIYINKIIYWRESYFFTKFSLVKK